jgi:hypothetical protein
MNIQTTKKVIIVYFYAKNVKTLNGSPPGSTTSYLMELEPIEYSYNGNGKNGKEKNSNNLLKIYYIKGIRGWMRHAGTELCISQNLEVCNTTDKMEDKHGVSFQIDELHPSGACENTENGENGPNKNGGTHYPRCIISRAYGHRGREGSLRFDIDPIADIKHKTANLPFPVQNVKIRVENRHSKTVTGRVAQDFAEQYFTGNLSFEIDVTRCDLQEIGFTIKSLTHLKKLGRGKNAGYGQTHLKGYKVVDRRVTFQETWNEETDLMELSKINDDTNISKEIIPMAKKAWREYINEHQKTLVEQEELTN